jgi:hypothetical protein
MTHLPLPFRLAVAFLGALLTVNVASANAGCPFDDATMSFKGTPLEQAKCLLRPVRRHGELSAPLAHLPSPLEQLIGFPVTIPTATVRKYLAAHGIKESDVGGALTNHLAAKYFVIHDTSTPNYGDKAFPTNINQASWSHNTLKRWSENSNAVAHCFVNRLGDSVSPHAWTTPWRATKLETRVLGEKSKGIFVHTELIQPRRRDPSGGPRNDALSPEPGFTEAQLDRLALLYVTASLQHGTWLVPAYHAALDAGIPNGHDDPQNFDLALWAERLSLLLNVLTVNTGSAR